MADEREGAEGPTKRAANEDRMQTAGRAANAAQPLDAADSDSGPERYPPVRQDDAVEGAGRTGQLAGQDRSFDPKADAPTPRQGAGDTSPEAAKQQAFKGPEGDPAEGKR